MLQKILNKFEEMLQKGDREYSIDLLLNLREYIDRFGIDNNDLTYTTEIGKKIAEKIKNSSDPDFSNIYLELKNGR